MNIEIIARCIRLRQIEDDIKQLRKKFPSVEKDLLYIERLLEAGSDIPQTFQYTGFGEHKIFKTRVINTDLKKGKSSGYRLIYEEKETEDDRFIVELLLYSKKKKHVETETRAEIRRRLNCSDYFRLL